MSVKSVNVRNVKIGGGAPVSVQSMSSRDAHDFEGICSQIRELSDAGCDIVRLAVPDKEAAEVFARVRKETEMPLVADIHFDYRLAIAAIEAGADKIRINPASTIKSGSYDSITWANFSSNASLESNAL